MIKETFTDLEIWKPVRGYEGSREVSNMGNVRNRDGNYSLKTSKAGYACVTFWTRKDKTPVGRTLFVHRLVADAFCGPLTADMDVHHIDRNKLNKKLSNLEIVVKKEHHMQHIKERRKGIFEIDANGEVIGSYESICDCARQTGLNKGHISAVVHGIQHQTNGRYFKFWEEDTSPEM